ncbi:MAG: DUF4340 domain-containing protein [Deltaproteobacteria bacterium]|jgi:hypothetical protein|nr:DUF4340 domain-containing protein [Deltaproteobacteria bacterium]
MKKINFVLAGILILQLLVAFFKPSGSTSFQIDRVSLYSNLDSKKINKIIVENPQKTKKDQRVTLIRNNENKWIIIEAHNYPAERSTVDEILTVVPKLKNAKLASDNPKQFASFELGENNSKMRLRLYQEDKEAVNLLIGKSMIQGTFVRKDQSDKIYEIGTSLASFLYLTPSDYFASSSLKLPAVEKRKKIELVYKGNKTVFSRTSPAKQVMNPQGQLSQTEAKWTVQEEGDNPYPSTDATAVSNFISSVASINFAGVEGTLKSKDSAKYGFANPFITLEFTDEEKKTVTIKVGAKIEGTDSESRYLFVDNSEFVFALDKSSYQDWTRETKAFVKEEVKELKLPEDGKLKMDIPKTEDMKLTIPGMDTSKDAKNAIITP